MAGAITADKAKSCPPDGGQLQTNNNHINAKNQSTLSFRYALFSLITGWLSSSRLRVNFDTLLPAALFAE
jgi:hypothetical protein